MYEHGSNFRGEMEVDEAYFRAKQIKGKRGRGGVGKTQVSRYFTEAARSTPRSSQRTSKPLFRVFWGKVDPVTFIHTD